MKILTISLLLILLIACEKNPCNQVVTAFDIGSASTKMVVANVNTCKSKVNKILWESQLKVNYKESLSNSSSFPKKIQEKGKKAIKELMQISKNLGSKKVSGVATEAFRNAQNGKNTALIIGAPNDLKIIILSQDQEAQLGFLAAKAHAKNKDIISWDIGGGSMQFSDGITIYRGKLAAVTFKNKIISDIQKRKSNSPNPMTPLDQTKAMKVAQMTAVNDVPESLRPKFKTHMVLGIGSVHYYAIKRQTGHSIYDQTILLKTIQKLSGKTDGELGGDYASTDFTNLLLVYGFMKGLSIEKVQVVKANLAHGLLLKN